jgi:hypothetical protein
MIIRSACQALTRTQCATTLLSSMADPFLGWCQQEGARQSRQTAFAAWQCTFRSVGSLLPRTRVAEGASSMCRRRAGEAVPPPSAWLALSPSGGIWPRWLFMPAPLAVHASWILIPTGC